MTSDSTILYDACARRNTMFQKCYLQHCQINNIRCTRTESKLTYKCCRRISQSPRKSNEATAITMCSLTIQRATEKSNNKLFTMCCRCSTAVVPEISTQKQILLLLVAPLPLESCERNFRKILNALLLPVATDDDQLSKGKSTCDYYWYSLPLLSLFSFSL
jgi:hypothetical protein